jgi:hypothetical protein
LDRVRVNDAYFASNAEVFAAWTAWTRHTGLTAKEGAMVQANVFSRVLGTVLPDGIRRGKRQLRLDSGVRTVVYGWWCMWLPPPDEGHLIPEKIPQNLAEHILTTQQDEVE